MAARLADRGSGKARRASGLRVPAADRGRDRWRRRPPLHEGLLAMRTLRLPGRTTVSSSMTSALYVPGGLGRPLECGFHKAGPCDVGLLDRDLGDCGFRPDGAQRVHDQLCASCPHDGIPVTSPRASPKQVPPRCGFVRTVAAGAEDTDGDVGLARESSSGAGPLPAVLVPSVHGCVAFATPVTFAESSMSEPQRDHVGRGASRAR